MNTVQVNGHSYLFVPPQADSDELAARGHRVLLYLQAWQKPVFITAPQGVVTAGWVIGVDVLDAHPTT